MNGTPGTIDAIPLEERNRLESLLLDFDQSGAPDAIPQAIQRLLVELSALRRVGLVELIKIDIERYWEHGTRRQLEDYFAALPELGGSAEVPAELVAAEFEIRHQFGDPVTIDTLTERFPTQAAAVRMMIQQHISEGTTGLRRRLSVDTATRVGDTQSMVPESGKTGRELTSSGRPPKSGSISVATPRQNPSSAATPSRLRWSLAAVLGTLILLGVIITIRTKDGSLVTIEVPDGATVSVERADADDRQVRHSVPAAVPVSLATQSALGFNGINWIDIDTLKRNRGPSKRSFVRCRSATRPSSATWSRPGSVWRWLMADGASDTAQRNAMCRSNPASGPYRVRQSIWPVCMTDVVWFCT